MDRKNSFGRSRRRQAMKDQGKTFTQRVAEAIRKGERVHAVNFVTEKKK